MTRWTIKRLEAALCAIGAMLAGEEGEGDGADVAFTDLYAAQKRLFEERERLEKRK